MGNIVDVSSDLSVKKEADENCGRFPSGLDNGIFQARSSPYRVSMSSILTGLADCLPQECFTEKYTD